MKKRQTKKKQNKETNLKKKAKQGEEWWGKENFRVKKREEQGEKRGKKR
jgi:hypothetical protein